MQQLQQFFRRTLLVMAMLVSVTGAVKAQFSSTPSILASAGGTANDRGFATAVDATGNVYVAGIFSGTATFGSMSITSDGGLDAFIAKYNSAGVLQWVKRGGGVGSDIAHGIAVSGNAVYVMGGFSGTANFNTPSAAGSNELVSAGGIDIFVAKYDTDGNFVWAKRAGGIGNDAHMNSWGEGQIAVSGNGVYIASYFTGTANFNTPSASGTNELTSAGNDDILLAKYDTDGNFIWAKRAGGTGTDIATDIAISGNAVYITGYFNGTADFNTPTAAGSNELVSAGSSDLFVAKYDTDGNFAWAKRVGGVSLDRGYGIAAAGSSVYITGDFVGTADFNTPTATGINELVSAGDGDIFVAKYDADGNFVWGRRAGGTSNFDQGYSIAANATSVYATGRVGSNISNFNTPSAAGSNEITLLGSNDIFLVQYTADGTLSAFTNLGGSGADIAYNITLAGDAIYITGIFNGTASFSVPPTPGSSELTSLGNFDVFLAKYGVGPSCPTVTISPAATALPAGTIGTAYSQTITQTGFTGTVTWSATGLPAGLSIAPATGVISGTPTALATNANVTVTATSGACAADKSYTLTVSAAPCPTVTVSPAAIVLPAGTIGTAYSQAITQTGLTGTVTWSATGLPAGLSIAPATGVISGTPTATATNANVTVTATDGTCSSNKDYTLSISCPTVTVSPAATALPAGTIGVAYSQTITQTGLTGTVTWSATGLPAGLSIAPATGVISGTPTALATNANVTVTATAGVCTADKSYTLTVSSCPTVTISPAPTALAAGTIGVAYSQTITQTGLTGPVTWSATGLPAGLGIDASTGVISGTPTALVTNANVTVTATAGVCAADKSYTLTVACPTVTVSPAATALPAGTIGVAYNQSITQTGLTGTVTWSATGLPAGLSINPSTGAISGTPTATATNANVTVTATAGVCTADKSYTLTVTCPTSSLSPTTVVGGTAGVAYTQNITQTGLPAGTITWSATGLPTGLSINPSTGVISGTPTVAGSFSVPVTATSGVCTATRTYTLNIALAAPTGLALTNPGLNSFDAAWNAVVGATGYQIDIATTSAFTAGTLVVNNQAVSGTSFNATGLAQGTLYFVRVRGTNGTVNSPNSTSAQISTLLPAPTFGASPFTNVDFTSFTVSWNAVTNATAYRYDVATAADFATASLVSNNVNSTTTSANLSGLIPGTRYFVRVRATNANTTSVSSVTVEVITPLRPPVFGAQPFSAWTTSGFTVSWLASENASAYQIDVATAADFNAGSILVNNQAVNGLNTAITGLQPGTRYFVRVRATNAVTTSANSAVVNTVTLLLPPTFGPNPITNIRENAFDVTWQPVTGLLFRYELDVATDAAFTQLVFTAVRDQATTVEVIPLLPNTRYYVRVRAINVINLPSANSVTVSTITLPRAPQFLSLPITSIGSNGFTAVWEANPLNITGYRYDLSLSATFANFVAQDVAAASSPVVLQNLNANTTYYFRVRAVNESGVSQSSSTQSALTLPAVPQNLAAVRGPSFNQNVVTWTNPAANATGVSILVQRAVSGNATFVNVSPPLAASTNMYVDMTGVPGVSYIYRVVVRNETGSVFAVTGTAVVTSTEDALDASLQVWPNPGRTVRVQVEGLEGGMEVVMRDLLGREVLRQQTADNTLEINGDHLTSGTYVIEVRTSRGTAVRKWVKE